MAEELQEALLVRSREAEWDKVEDGTQTASSITVQQLIRQDPNNVIQYISNSGVSKLGEFKIEELQELQKATVGSKGPNGKKGDSSKHKPPGTRTPCMFNDECFMRSRRFL
eukprot:jgi/Chrzof1/15203/Cz09g31150.t1